MVQNSGAAYQRAVIIVWEVNSGEVVAHAVRSCHHDGWVDQHACMCNRVQHVVCFWCWLLQIPTA